MEIVIENASAYAQANVSVRLSYNQRMYKVNNDKGRPFWVRQVTYSGGGKVSMSGLAILADGTSGVTDRYASIPLAVVPPVIVSALLRESWTLIAGGR